MCKFIKIMFKTPLEITHIYDVCVCIYRMVQNGSWQNWKLVVKQK